MMSLLIEPVWNRNEDEKPDSASEVDILLIEPVWNRNDTVVNVSGSGVTVAFNRTSMESKLDVDAGDVDVSELLIEPVWNRNNKSFSFGRRADVTFNRTSMESKQ